MVRPAGHWGTFPASRADFGALKPDLDAVNLLHAASDLAGREVEPFRHVDAVDVHDGVVAALGKHVDQHGQRQRIVEHGVLRIDQRDARDRVAQHDRNDLVLDETDHLRKQRAMLQFIAVEPLDQLLAGMDDNLASPPGRLAGGPPFGDRAPACSGSGAP